MLSEPVHGISDSVVCATSKALDQPAQSGQSLCLSIECSVTVGMLTGRRLGFLCLGVGGCAGSSGSARVGRPHCWKCHMPLFIYYPILLYTCALEIFVVKTNSLSKALLLFFAFFAFRAPTCQQDGNTLQIKLCLTVFFP